MLSEISDRERQILYGFTYMWTLKNQQTSKTKQIQTHRNRVKTGKGNTVNGIVTNCTTNDH